MSPAPGHWERHLLTLPHGIEISGWAECRSQDVSVRAAAGAEELEEQAVAEAIRVWRRNGAPSLPLTR